MCVPQHAGGVSKVDLTDATLVKFKDEFGDKALEYLVKTLEEREAYNPSASVPTMVREPACLPACDVWVGRRGQSADDQSL